MALTLMIKALLVGGAILIGIGTGYVYKKMKKDSVIKVLLKEDGIVEELAEDVLESQTGLKVDFSPESPEEGEIYH